MTLPERISSVFLLATSLAIGLTAAELGIYALVGLSDTYRTEDVLHDDGPLLFAAWLKRHASDGTLQPETISRRLLAMPIASRRATVDAMMNPSFRDILGERESERVAVLKTLEPGVLEFLGTAPTSGDLWLAASRLRTLNSGFDKDAESFLALSYLLAPREAGLARTRLVFVTSVSPLLRRSFATERSRDQEIVKARYPGFERRYRDWFASREAVRVDDPRPGRTVVEQ